MIVLVAAAEAAQPDVAALDAFYAGAVSDKGVDYALLETRRAALDGWLASVEDAPVSSWPHDAQLAFWIDAYDALTMSIVLDAMPIASLRDLDGGSVCRRFRGVPEGEIVNADPHQQNALWFLAQYARMELIPQLVSGTLTPTWAEYDWSLNAAPPGG